MPAGSRIALEVREAATVVCLRRRPDGSAAPARRHLCLEDYQFQPDWTEFTDVFSPANRTAAVDTAPDGGASIRGHGNAGGDTIDFVAGWQVLMGQAEVVNWVRSSADEQALMRCESLSFALCPALTPPGQPIAPGLAELRTPHTTDCRRRLSSPCGGRW